MSQNEQKIDIRDAVEDWRPKTEDSIIALCGSIAQRVEEQTIQRCYLELQMRGSSYTSRIGAIERLYATPEGEKFL